HDGVHQELLAVRRHNVLVRARDLHRAADMRGEKRDRWFGVGSLAVRQANRNRHKLAIERNIEQLLTIRPPAHLRTAIGGDLHLSTGTGKGLDPNLHAAGLVRLIRDPLSIGRELTIPLFEGRLNDRYWFSLTCIRSAN